MSVRAKERSRQGQCSDCHRKDWVWPATDRTSDRGLYCDPCWKVYETPQLPPPSEEGGPSENLVYMRALLCGALLGACAVLCGVLLLITGLMLLTIVGAANV